MRYSIYLIPILILVTLSSCSLPFAVKGVRQKVNVFNPIWVKNNDPSYLTGNLPIALNSPLIHEGAVYSGHNKGEMQAYSLKDGRLLWSERDKGSYHAQPVVWDELLIYGTVAGRVYGRERLTGKLVYAVDLGSSIESAGVLYKGRVFFHTRNHQLFSLDAKTGKIFWAYKRSVAYLTTLQRASKPAIYNNRLYVGFADGAVVSFSIEEGVPLWETRIAQGTKFIDGDATPFLYQGKLFVGSESSSINIIDPKTGLVLRQIDYSVNRKPLEVVDGLIIGTTEGELVLLDKSLKELRRVKLSLGGISSIKGWRKGLIISTVLGELFHVDYKTFNILERKHLGHKASAVFGTISQDDGHIAIISSRNRLYVF